MTLSDYRSRLSHLPFVIDLPKPMRERVAMCLLWIGQPAQFHEGDVIFTQGDEHENTGCLLLSGAVEVLHGERNAKSVIAPDLLGEMTQWELATQRPLTIQAIANAHTLMFSWHDFVAFSGMLLTSGEQFVLRDIIRSSATRHHVNKS